MQLTINPELQSQSAPTAGAHAVAARRGFALAWPARYGKAERSEPRNRTGGPVLRTPLVVAAALAALLLAAGGAARGEPTIPNFWDARERLPEPDLDDLARLRFLTTIDFPPFNFLDAQGRLSGFHVDLARAICAELELGPRCQIQALPWDELEAALERGQGEALIAGTAITADARRRYAFSRAYLQFPARFIMRAGATAQEPLAAALAGRRVGVLDGSAHERLLRDFFTDVQPVVYDRSEWMLGDLKQNRIDAVFGDGMRLSFWLAGSASETCCSFAGGPYLAPGYLGHGLAIAVPRGRAELAAALDHALAEIHADGRFAELYLRYFPIGFF